MIISFIFNEKFSHCHFFQGTRTGLGKTVTPWALASRDPHCLRLEDFLAAQMGKEAVVRLGLDLEYSGVGQEEIKRRLEGLYLKDQEEQ